MTPKPPPVTSFSRGHPDPLVARLSAHPFKTVGLRAAAALVGRDAPDSLTADDLDQVVQVIITDVLATWNVTRNGPGWAWWQTVSAAYPNSPAVHHAIRRAGQGQMRDRLEALFASDDTGSFDPLPCWFCERATTSRWGNSLLPLAESGRYLNTQPYGGQPVCRVCRAAIWALPYGSSCDGRHLLTAYTLGDPALEQQIVAAHVERARRVIDHRQTGWLPASRSLAIRQQLIRHAASTQLDLLIWRNDLREPTLRHLIVPGPVVGWFTRTAVDPPAAAALAAVAAASASAAAGHTVQPDPLLLLAAPSTDADLHRRALLRVAEAAVKLCADRLGLNADDSTAGKHDNRPVTSNQLGTAVPFAHLALGLARATAD